MQLSPRSNLETCWNCEQHFPGVSIFILDKDEPTVICRKCSIEWNDWYRDRFEELKDRDPSSIN